MYKSCPRWQLFYVKFEVFTKSIDTKQILCYYIIIGERKEVQMASKKKKPKWTRADKLALIAVIVAVCQLVIALISSI